SAGGCYPVICRTGYGAKGCSRPGGHAIVARPRARNKKTGATRVKRYDYVIVGAGAAGCVLANRLTEDSDVKVLILEAGGPENNMYMHMPLGWRQIWRGPMHNWNYYSEPEPYLGDRKIMAPRGKTLGGSTSINGMLYIRGNRLDYDQWRQMGNTGW